MINRLLFSLILVLHLSSFGQDKYPKDVFRSPLDIPLVLAGTFGELRSNHFHSGIDIKTQQRQGLPIFAIGDGTITSCLLPAGLGSTVTAPEGGRQPQGLVLGVRAVHSLRGWGSP